MSEISNKTLAFLLVGAIAISLMGTLFSLNRLGRIGEPIISGEATTNSGQASMTIASSLSIRLEVSSLDFGNCRPGSAPGSWFESNNTAIDGTGIGQCDNLQTVGNITIENDGSAVANVSINISTTDLTGGLADNRSIWFASRNTTTRAGCNIGINHNWQNMTATIWENKTCTNLNFSDSNDRFMIFFAVWAPSDSVAASRTATVTFVARGY
jgi:hypothetical protein